MAFFKKTWKDRQSEYPNRRKLLETGIANVYEVSRSEGTVMEEGDLLNAANLNDLEERIDSAISSAETAAAQAGAAAADAGATAQGAAESAANANSKINTMITDITAIKYVTALPSSPDAKTLYLIKK